MSWSLYFMAHYDSTNGGSVNFFHGEGGFTSLGVDAIQENRYGT